MKRKKQNTQDKSALQRFTELPAEKKRRLFLKSAVSLGVMGVAAGAISGYDAKKRELHDLTSIGAGKPVVVQIHDTSCPICRRLKSRSMTVLGDQEEIQFRIADIVTAKGRELQEKYGVQKTTLLLFDAEGNLVDTVFGLQTIEELEQLFARRFPSVPA